VKKMIDRKEVKHFNLIEINGKLAISFLAIKEKK